MIIDKLLSDLLVHPRKRIVSSGQVSGKVGEGFLHEILNAKPLLLGDTGRKAKTVNAAADSDPSGVDRGAGVDVPLDLGDVHVARMDRIRGDAVVLLNQRIEHIGKNLEFMLYHYAEPIYYEKIAPAPSPCRSPNLQHKCHNADYQTGRRKRWPGQE